MDEEYIKSGKDPGSSEDKYKNYMTGVEGEPHKVEDS